MSHTPNDPFMLILILCLGIMATEPWRWLGVMVSTNLNHESELLTWIRAVATALIAALVVRLILSPPGNLAATPDLARITSLSISFAAYFALKRNLMLAIAIGVISFMISLELALF